MKVYIRKACSPVGNRGVYQVTTLLLRLFPEIQGCQLRTPFT